MKKRIFWLSDANTAHTRRWIGVLSEIGYKVLLFSFTEPESDWTLGMDNVDIETGGFSTRFAYSSEAGWQKLGYIRSVPKVRALRRAFNPAVVHAHYVSSYGLLATLAQLRPRVVSAWGADVYSAPERSRVHRQAIRYVLSSADKVLSTSWVMRDRVLQFTDRPVHVVPFGIDVSRFAPDAGNKREGGRFTIGSVKTLEHKYGLEYLVRGFAIFRDSHPIVESRLLVVGGGSLRSELEKLALSLDIADVTEFRGRVDYDHVHECHQELDVAVYPSVLDSESFGVSVIESQACGVPVIVSRAGGLTEVVQEGVTGFVVERRDPEAIAGSLARLASDPVLRRRFGEAGRERVVREYSLEKAASLLTAQYSRWEHH